MSLQAETCTVRHTPSLRADVHQSVHKAPCIRLVQFVFMSSMHMGKLAYDSVSTDVHPLDWSWLDGLLTLSRSTDLHKNHFDKERDGRWRGGEGEW